MATEIAPGIFITEHQVADGKNGIIFGERAVLAIDAGTYPEEGQVMADFIRSRGREPDRMALTHGHPDHVLGSGVFIGAEVIAHTLCVAEIERLLPAMAQRINLSSQEVAARIAWPTLTFSGELRLDLGGKRVRLFPTPGHSQDGISVYVEEDRVLIAGDAVVTGIVPAIGAGDSRILEATLHKLLALDIEVIVPGHGEVVRGADQVGDWLQWIIGYLSGVRAFVKDALDRSLAPQDIAHQVDYDAFIGNRLPRERHNMPKRHIDTVNKIIEELLQGGNA